MPNVVTKGYKFVIIYYRREILINIKYYEMQTIFHDKKQKN